MADFARKESFNKLNPEDTVPVPAIQYTGLFVGSDKLTWETLNGGGGQKALSATYGSEKLKKPPFSAEYALTVSQMTRFLGWRLEVKLPETLIQELKIFIGPCTENSHEDKAIEREEFG